VVKLTKFAKYAQILKTSVASKETAGDRIGDAGGGGRCGLLIMHSLWLYYLLDELAHYVIECLIHTGGVS